MSEIVTAYVRIRPSLEPDARTALEGLERDARALADGLAVFLSNFAPEPPQLEEPHD